MRVLHTADWHLGDRLGRIDRSDDLHRAVDRVAAICDEERVDVLLMAGDLFSELIRPDGLRETVRRLGEAFLPFFLRGGTILAVTGNHDNEVFCRTLSHALSLAAPSRPEFGGRIAPGRFYLADEPSLARLADRDGFDVQFVLMPWPTARGYWSGSNRRFGNIDERNRALSEAFTLRMKQIALDPQFRRDQPAVLAAHIQAEGAIASNLYRISERESVMAWQRDFPDVFAYVALGHIHLPQSLWGKDHVRYSGSIERLDIGEKDDAKQVAIFDIGPDGLRGSPWERSLPSSPFLDIAFDNPSEALPRLRERYSPEERERALARCRFTYQAGRDSLDAILREIDDLFPRWYARDWTEASMLEKEERTKNAWATKSVRDTVIEYLGLELTDHPESVEILKAAESLLAEDNE